MGPTEIRHQVLKRYRDKGVTRLARVPVRVKLGETVSYCEGYPVKITLGALCTASLLRGSLKFERTLVHEYGHALLFKLWYKLTRKDQRKWEACFGAYEGPEDRPGLLTGIWTYYLRSLCVAAATGTPLYNTNAYATMYAASDPHEDWAETVTAYIMDDAISLKEGVVHKVETVKYFLNKFMALKA